MKFSFLLVAIALVFSAQKSSAGTVKVDHFWLYPDVDTVFTNIILRDTTEDTVIKYPQIDTGDAFSGKYFNVNYQFTQGYNAIKLLWDSGKSLFFEIDDSIDASNFDSLTLEYKLPNPNHTLTVLFVSSEGCGGDPTFDSLGIVPSSTSWKRAAFFIPNVVRTRNYWRELRFYIHNKAGVTSLTSTPSDFKLDNIMLKAKAYTKAVYTYTPNLFVGNKSYFVPVANTEVHVSIVAMNGTLVSHKTVSVNGGTKYNIRDFATKNAVGFSKQNCVAKINGNGINIIDKLW